MLIKACKKKKIIKKKTPRYEFGFAPFEVYLY